MYYVCICGTSYGNLGFDERERIRESLRRRIESADIRFVEYCWVWDENDKCLLVAGTYERLDDAGQWIKSLESLGFEIEIRTQLPGEAESPGIRHGWDLASKL